MGGQTRERIRMVSHAPKDYKCPFCLLTQGISNEHVFSVASDVVYRDAAVTAFVSSHQYLTNSGSMLVIPNRHIENVYDVPAELAAELHRSVRMIAIAMKSAFACDGISTRQHNEPGGDQYVWHYHIHVTPRYHGDHLYLSVANGEQKLMPALERAYFAKKIQAQLLSDVE